MTQQERVLAQAREDWEQAPDVEFEDDAVVHETRDGYWIQAWVFIEKEII